MTRGDILAEAERGFGLPSPAMVSVSPAGEPASYEFSWTTAGGLSAEILAWRDLADNAVEPNPVYCANFLMATEKYLCGGRPIRLLVARERRDNSLAALAPLEERDWRNGFPGRAYSMFANSYMTLTHPLIRRQDASAILSEMLRFLAREGRGRDWLLLPSVSEGRGFHALLSEVARRDGLALARVNGLNRPAVEPETGKGGALYAQSYVSRSRRSNNERRLRRLREVGAVEFRGVFVCEPGGAEALQAFLELERASWKGEAGTALLSQQATRDFAYAALSGANQAPRVRIRSLMLDERPIAMALDLESQGVAYAFKAAYDPNFAHFSPGLMLDAHTASQIGDQFEIKRLDSFAQTEIAQAAVWRQEESVGRFVLALSAKARGSEALARRLRIATAVRNHAKHYRRRSHEIASRSIDLAGSRKWPLVVLTLAASLPALSVFLKRLL